MDIEVNEPESAEREIVVSLEADEWKKYEDEVLDDLKDEVKVKGFRKGKTPKDVLKKQIGEEKVQSETIQLAVERSYPDALTEEDLEPVSQPEIQVTKISQGGKLEYKARFAVRPEVKLGKYKGIKIDSEEEDIEVEDKEVEESLEHLQKRRAQVKTVQREAQNGDRVEIDFVARHKDVKIEGGESENHPLILGEGQFPEEFEKELVGMQKGDDKEFSVEFPDDFPRSEFAGKKLDFEVTMKLVQEVELPELDDEFAKGLGGFDDMKDLRSKIKQGITREKEDEQGRKLNQQLLGKIVENAEVELSDLLVERELDNMMKEFENEISQTGLSMEDYLERLDQSKEELRENWRDTAKKRLKTRFVLDEIAEKEEITVDEKEVEEEVEGRLKNLNPQQINEKVDLQRLKAYTERKMVDEKVVEFLKENAQY